MVKTREVFNDIHSKQYARRIGDHPVSTTFSAGTSCGSWDALTPYIDKVDIDTVLKLSLV